MTVDELPSRLTAHYPGRHVEVIDNIVRITPEHSPKAELD